MRRLAWLLLLWAGCVLGQARTPAETVDAFHGALRNKDTAGALSLLDRELVVFEFGTADSTAEAYAFRHLPFDMDVAVATRWKLETRKAGGEGSERWVLSTYRVTGKAADDAACKGYLPAGPEAATDGSTAKCQRPIPAGFPNDWKVLVDAAIASNVCNQPADGGKCNPAAP